MFLLSSIYGYNTKAENMQLYDRLSNGVNHLLGKYHNMNIIIGGDFNLTLNDTLDRFPPKANTNPNTVLENFMSTFGLTDVWRQKNNSKVEFTWQNKTGSFKSRIDFWLVSDLIADEIKSEILPAPLSDHKLILIEKTKLNQFGKNKITAYWKLNSLLLENKTVAENIKQTIIKYWNTAQSQKEFSKNWELLKYELRKMLMKTGAEIAKRKRKVESEVVKEIILLNNVLPENLSEEQKIRLNHLQLNLDNIYISKAKGAYIRSRQKWLEEGEKNSSYFFRLEKKHQISNSIMKLQINNNICEDPVQISSYCETFFQELYQSKCSDETITQYINSLNKMQKISLEEREGEDIRTRVVHILQKVVPDLKGKTDDAVDMVHRLGRKTDNRKRHVIILFTHRRVKEDIWKRSKGSAVCKEAGIQFAKMMPKEDLEERRRLWPQIEQARRAGKQAFFPGPHGFIEGRRIGNG
ncbi:uncharacterized protein LOC118559590 [Fundulus heteroclitus]|uniref:uncharacterized protein LOC118559590 n=1 Tax=Fundulus heteroclitus TaxID=8078 RepID=UPI00165AA445|nr:uncharacterized protein LOC118559590 [Fundulus heteroclitus]